MKTSQYAWKASLLASRGDLPKAIETAKCGLGQAEAEVAQGGADNWERLHDLLELKLLLGELLAEAKCYADALPYAKSVAFAVIPANFEGDLFDHIVEEAEELLTQCNSQLKPRLP